MLEVVGKWSCGLADIAERHDDYLDEAYLPPDGTQALKLRAKDQTSGR
jgi:hypothetical protein